jgi:replicative DNA helicase
VLSAADHGKIVLAAILPSRKDLLEKAQLQLTVDHFPDATLKTIFKAMDQFHERTSGVLTEVALLDMLSVDAGRESYYSEVFRGLVDASVDDTDFAWSVHQLRELYSTRLTEAAITNAMEVLKVGKTLEEDEEPLEGHEAARAYLQEQLSLIERDSTLNESPEGDMGAEAREIMEDYIARREARKAGTSPGVKFGLPALDDLVGGLQRGELCLVAAYSGVGKTNFCVNAMWDAAVMQGKNVVIMSTETTRDQIRRNLVARHSKHSKFGLEDGLDSAAIRSGMLNPAEEKSLNLVLRDLADPAYGKRYIKQVPKGASLTWVESSLRAIGKQFPVDLVIIDYLALLRSDKKRNTDREELNNIMKDAKLLATSFNDGQGVPLVSPWQVNRTGFAAAEQSGYYSSDHLAETSEAVNSSDLIVSLLQQGERQGRFADLRVQTLKNRDGALSNDIQARVDYATSHFRPPTMATGGSFQNLIVSRTDSSGLGGFM